MKVFKRWTSGVFSRVDWMVSQIENQEALINSALQESREAVARAKVQLGRVRQDGKKLRQRLQDEEQAVGKWRDRALQSAKDDEQRAMECLRRSKRSEQLTEQLQQRVNEHEQVESQLIKDVRTMEEKLAELIEKRNLMRTRQSRAEALTSIQGSCADTSGELEEIFDRWEVRVTEKELSGECTITNDSLEDSFATAEDDAQLREELKLLTGNQP